MLGAPWGEVEQKMWPRQIYAHEGRRMQIRVLGHRACENRGEGGLECVKICVREKLDA
jgi:hypothetical protein